MIIINPRSASESWWNGNWGKPKWAPHWWGKRTYIHMHLRTYMHQTVLCTIKYIYNA